MTRHILTILKQGIYFVLLILVVIACNERPLYNEYQLIPPAGWSADSSYVFEVEVEDVSIPYDLQVNIRHTGKYPYQNIWIFSVVSTPDSMLFSDTLSATLADHTGRWYSSGSGSLMLFSLPYQINRVIDRPGVYAFEIRHGMREDYLKGVHAVGVTLMKSQADGKK